MEEKTLGVARSHSVQTKYQHHQAGLEMEPTGEAEEREAKEQLATDKGRSDEKGRLQLPTVGETVTRQRRMERLKKDLWPPWSILQNDVSLS